MDKGYEEALKRIKEAREQNLSELDLNDLDLKELPKGIIDLKNLEIITLKNLNYFPEEILELKNLKLLALVNGKMEEIPKEIDKLENLKKLFLFHNNLSSLPKSLLNLKKLQTLHLEGNPKLNIPNEILLDINNPKKILNYYFNLQKSEKKNLSEAKVLFVGQGGVGKTSLIKSLLYGNYDKNELMTDGIKIDKFYEDDLTLNLWDFGGQEIMHTTHQFFFTKRSLYILVLSARADDELKRVDYWLKLISSFGADSPVIVVLNKIDDGNKEIDENRLKRKYPQIKAVLKTSCEIPKGIEELKKKIVSEAKELPHINETWIKEWFEIKEELEKLKENKMDFIPYSKFQELCQSKSIDELSQKTLIEFLHDLGVVLNFQDKNLNSTNVLNPRWVTEGVYKIINSKIPKDGILKRDELKEIFKESSDKYPITKLGYIIEMMKKFELLFEFHSDYLIPELLPSKEPSLNFDFEKNLTFIYYYDYLPTSIISRFITKANEFIVDELFWKNGVVIKYEELIALVLLDEFDKTISIFIEGENKKRFLTMIRHQINEINLTLSSLEINQEAVFDGVKVSFKSLLNHEKLEMNKILPENSDRVFDVKEVLDKIVDESEREKEIEKILTNTKESIGNENAKRQRTNQYLIKEVSKDRFNNEEETPLPFTIKQFKIKNYQSIKEASIDSIAIDSKWVFIAGYNGAGKSAILQALALGLSGIDFKMDREFKVAIELNTPIGAKLNNIIYFITHWNEPEFKLNKFATYGASRLAISEDDEKVVSVKHLFESESKLANIENWIIKKEVEKLKNNEKSKRILESTLKLLSELLPDINEIVIEGSEVLYIEESDKSRKIKLNELSHGHKSIVAMIGDLILRFIEVDSEIENFEEFKGIVFIDEFETHLHPIWQIEFVEKLSDYFPDIQFWATTHSPLPFIKAPKGSTILKVEKDEVNGTIIEDLGIDVSALSPDMILTSPFFDVKVLVNPDIDDNKIRSESTYQEMKENEQIDEFIKNKLKKLNLDDTFLEELRNDD